MGRCKAGVFLKNLSEFGITHTGCFCKSFWCDGADVLKWEEGNSICSEGITVAVDGNKVVVKEAENGLTVKQACLWSEYYFYNMPETLSITFDDLDSGKDYTVDIFAGSFWNTLSKPISTVVTTK